MACRSIADVLQAWLACDSGPLSSTNEQEPQPIEVADDPPVPPALPWVDQAKISAAARDVVERVFDDRTFAQKSENGSKALASALARARLSRPPMFNFGSRNRAKREPAEWEVADDAIE